MAVSVSIIMDHVLSLTYKTLCGPTGSPRPILDSLPAIESGCNSCKVGIIARRPDVNNSCAAAAGLSASARVPVSTGTNQHCKCNPVIHQQGFIYTPPRGGIHPPCDMSTHPLGRTPRGHKVVSTSA